MGDLSAEQDVIWGDVPFARAPIAESRYGLDDSAYPVIPQNHSWQLGDREVGLFASDLGHSRTQFSGDPVDQQPLVG